MSVLGWDISTARWYPTTKERSFDRSLGVETAEYVSEQNLDMDPLRRSQAVRYEPTSVPEFHHVLLQLRIQHEQYVFIDFGSGKGRVLMLACEYPFEQIIGIELSRTLHEIAKKNLASFRASAVRRDDCVCLCEDATSFKLPPKPAVLYFFNPFNDAVLSEVLANIEESLRQHPRDLIVIYNNPEHREVFDGSAAFSPATAALGDRWLVYRTA